MHKDFFVLILEHLCMFTEMGWLDTSLNFDNVTAESDVLSLPANVSINTTNFQDVFKELNGNFTPTL